jgi:hypothetical protein
VGSNPVLFENLSAEHIRQPAERADGDGLALEVIEAFDIGSGDKSMAEGFSCYINHFALELPGDHSVKDIGIGGKLHLPVDQRHGADLASGHQHVHIQIFLRKVSSLLGGVDVHTSGASARSADSHLSELSRCVDGKKQKSNENNRCD